MVSVGEYLYRRGKSYYFLIKIPVDIKPHLGNRQHDELNGNLLCAVLFG